MDQRLALAPKSARPSPGCVAILGMHRSGTSCLAGSLQQLGLFLGEVVDRNPDNLKGNREHKQLRLLNDAVLRHSGGSWRKPAGRLDWTDDHRAERDAILAQFRAASPGTFGFKDPRTVLTLPFWEESGTRFQFVGTYRHPFEVARSLNARNGFPIETGIQLWKEYNRRLIEIHARTPFPLVSFALPDEDYVQVVARMARSLGIQPRPDGTAFFEPSLRTPPSTNLHDEVDDECRQILAHLDGVSESAGVS